MLVLLATPAPKPDHPDDVVAPLLLLFLVVGLVVELDAEEVALPVFVLPCTNK